MSFAYVRTIDGRNLWLNLNRVSAFSYSSEEKICLVEISGGEPHQISLEEFFKIRDLLKDGEKRPEAEVRHGKAKKRKK